METIKDKLTARQVAMQMATDVMCAIIPRLSVRPGYEVDEHIALAKSLYSYLVGNAELPEVYDPNSRTDKLMDILTKARENFNHEPVWFPIIHKDSWLIRKSIPLYLRSKDGDIKVVGSVEEFDKIAESDDWANYTGYSLIISPDANNPFERDKKLDPHLTAAL